MPIKIEEDTIVGSLKFEWTIQEYDQHERNRAWYFFMLVVGFILIIQAVLTGNFLFALIIILFAIILFLQSHQEPLQVPFQITELGIIISDRFYTWKEFESFYIIYQPPQVKTLFLETGSIWRPILRIPLLDNNPIEIKHTLREFLAEDLEKEEEPISDQLGRNWRIH
ncbi:hypothetical protein KJ641_03470 [Patescibacteria group bacterium]|nr:hypothetical protein [Patescibacteria group bacterium]MBU1895903.1 hypothetical protein [Patescibacteria group bacterium]